VRTLLGLDALEAPRGGSAVTIGTFDGVHVGHRALIAATRGRAAERGLESVAITWDRHPNATLRPDRVPPLLSTPERKIELLEETGIGILAVLCFDEELSRWPPERFVADVLVGRLAARSVHVGEDWRFGHKASGDVALLRRLGYEAGFAVAPAPLVEVGGGAVSSTRVRSAVASGDLDLAHRLLGRPFEVQGVVVHGAHRGRLLGYPTANLALDDGLARPPRGVYAGEAVVAGRRLKAAVNVGVNPTFAADEVSTRPRVEAYLLDFDDDIYGELLRVGFHRRLRDERRFASVEELVAQMARDVEETRAPTC
jgi:riboflavin kinase/FMN adenylyltransferase